MPDLGAVSGLGVVQRPPAVQMVGSHVAVAADGDVQRDPMAADGDVGDEVLVARQAVIVAVGTGAVLPPIPGLADAAAWTNRAATTAKAVPERLIVLGGGVAANSVLRDRLASGAERLGVPLVVPRAGLCTDNAAMIGAAGWYRAEAGARAGSALDARPSLKLAV